MIHIKASERLAIIGATGMGKTIMAKYLLSRLERAVVIDPKATFRLSGYNESDQLPIFSRHFRLIVRPKSDERLASLIWEGFLRGSLTLYCDELNSLADRFPIATAILQDVSRMGREKRVGVWTAMQRPRHVPLSFLTETEVFLIFMLRSPDDRKYLQGFVGPEVGEEIDAQQFWYLRPGMKHAELLTLEMKKGQGDKNVEGVLRPVARMGVFEYA